MFWSRKAEAVKPVVLRVLSSAHGDREFNFTPSVHDEARRLAEEVVYNARGAQLLRIPGGDPAAPAEKIKGLDELQPGDQAMLLPRVVGG